VARRLRARSGQVDRESDVLAKIAEMSEEGGILADRIHAIVEANAPTLTPRTWYGMSAYAKDSKVICFFQSGHIDIWPTSFALKRLTAAV
jgi:hypothetical protein